MLAIICNRNPHSLLVGMQTGTLEATLEDSLAIYYKAKPTLTTLAIWSSNHSPWHLPRWFEILHPHKKLHTMFMAALLIIAEKNWKQLRYPSICERRKKAHGISYIMGY